MGRAFAVEPAEWPKIIKQLEAGESAPTIAEARGVSVATIYKIRDRAAAGPGPKATNGKPKPLAGLQKEKEPTNGAAHKLLTSEAGNQIVMPKIMEWISAFYHAQHDPAERPRLQRANAAIVLLAADLQAEL